MVGVQRPPKTISGVFALTSDDTAELETYRRFFRQIHRFIGILDREGRFIRCGDIAYELTGLTKEEVIGTTFWDCKWWADANAERQSRVLVEKALAGELNDRRIFFRRADGSIGTTHAMGQPDYNDAGEIVGAIVHGQDVTDLTVLEAERSEAVHHSEHLLEELSHRVKNSLAMIAAIARLQSRQIEEPSAKAALHALQARIVAVSQLYASLSNSDNVETVAIDSYLSNIVDSLRKGSARDGITVLVSADSARIPTATATAVGLIVNELVTNALKHDFSDDGPGTITVSYWRGSGNDQLCVTDDGRGLDDASDREADPTGMGQSLVELLTRQLDGEIVTSTSGGGTSVTLTLPQSAPDHS